MAMVLRTPVAAVALLGLALSLSSCSKDPDLVVYCSLDQEYGEPLVQRFERETGLDVRVEFDVEANKNVGLSTRIREESARPRCDVFWSNEFAQVISMGEDGLLLPYVSPSAAEIPPQFKGAAGLWHGFAARARVLIVNTKLADPTQIKSMWDVLDPRWKGKAAMAKPLAGTTHTHMIALYEALGEGEARRYLQTAQALAQAGDLNLAGGNAHVMRLVREGQCAFGWTDTDDFNVAREAGAPVVAVYPDADGVGTLLIPNTVCILKTTRHEDHARRFVDWVLRPEIEAELAASRSAQIPLRASVARPAHVQGPPQIKVMAVDLRAVGKAIKMRSTELQQLFLQ